ncbi:hypothetical protein AB6N23_01855 [Cellulomonas sp. 179-A 9B4 NHS]|uniref:hypothetical protein n=1 Tax=Cellulomonas sp. 179-A 9B4 NHS TaxID=3142379 RepID=UPI00399F96A9
MKRRWLTAMVAASMFGFASAPATASTTEAASVEAAVGCVRQADWYLSCKCPAAYTVTVFWEATASPSFMYYGYSHAHMTAPRSGIGGGVWGVNPFQTTGTGAKSKSVYTSGPVYFSPGGGSQADRSKNMGARCNAASLVAAS